MAGVSVPNPFISLMATSVNHRLMLMYMPQLDMVSAVQVT